MDFKDVTRKTKDEVIRLVDTLLGTLERGVDTVTGKAAVEEVVKFAQQTDAVNTAIVTRIYQILASQTKLEEKIKHTRDRPWYPMGLISEQSYKGTTHGDSSLERIGARKLEERRTQNVLKVTSPNALIPIAYLH